MEYVHERFRCWRRKIVACYLVLLVEDDEREVKRGKTKFKLRATFKMTFKKTNRVSAHAQTQHCCTNLAKRPQHHASSTNVG